MANEVSIEDYLDGMVRDLRDLTTALVTCGRLQEAHNILGVAMHLEQHTGGDDFDSVAWPPQVRESLDPDTAVIERDLAPVGWRNNEAGHG